MVDKCTQVKISDLKNLYGNFENMSVCVKKLSGKGLSLVAQKDIPRGRVVAYYRTVLVPKTNRCFNYQFADPRVPKGKSRVLDVEQHGMVKYGIPYVAMFSNEPSADQESNCTIEVIEKRPSSVHVDYRLITKKNVKHGEELTWCYGINYPRQYGTPCKLAEYYE